MTALGCEKTGDSNTRTLHQEDKVSGVHDDACRWTMEFGSSRVWNHLVDCQGTDSVWFYRYSFRYGVNELLLSIPAGASVGSTYPKREWFSGQ